MHGIGHLYAMPVMSFLAIKSEQEHATMGVDNVAAPTTSFMYYTVLGLTYGFMHIIGPDHLGTLMSLSAASTPRRAFTVGAAWSLGHCVGMVAIALFLVALQKATAIDVEAWEHFGDYIIGFSMIVCGMYFVIREDQYLQEAEDGSVSLRSCECCHQGPSSYGAMNEHLDEKLPARPPKKSGRKPGKLQACASYRNSSFCGDENCPDEPHKHEHTQERDDGCPGDSTTDGEVASGQEEGVAPSRATSRAAIEAPELPVAAPGQDAKEATTSQSYAGALLGVFQGMCCPMGLVGITFIASLPATGILTFLLSFLLVSALGTGLIAYIWAMMMRAKACTSVSSKAMYRSSCYFTVALGIAWVVANACGVLESLNYAEHHHKSQMQMLQEHTQSQGVHA
mmetsp:Transcript_171240/g.549035  ORF Transcript_171240/g.549035 Transcript_171240/m.549035 type:complete len:396 (-) Transcript_171240:76-1263(-)